ncbi:MAG: hypothetical protein WAV07_07310 [Candidatus Contendobacter sp.]
MTQISRDMIGGVFFATFLLVGGLALAADKLTPLPSEENAMLETSVLSTFAATLVCAAQSGIPLVTLNRGDR